MSTAIVLNFDALREPSTLQHVQLGSLANALYKRRLTCQRF